MQQVSCFLSLFLIRRISETSIFALASKDNAKSCVIFLSDATACLREHSAPCEIFSRKKVLQKFGG